VHHTTAGAPIAAPTPLPPFSPVPALNKLMLHSLDDPNVDRPRDPSSLVYVPESHAERAARAGRMSSPLRRGAHESWWTSDQGWFNAVAKVGTEEEECAVWRICADCA
jgi:2-oxoisovalerate dehydrogenase E1 component alpha subunit